MNHKTRVYFSVIVAAVSLIALASTAAAEQGSREFRGEPARTPVAEAPSLKVKSVEVSGINNGGQVVGTLETKSGVHHGFVWTSGSVKLLGAEADVINDRGQILGYTKYSKAHGLRHLVLWENGNSRSVGLSGFQALNDRGQVLGKIDGGAAIWQNGAVSLLPLRSAVAMNNQGQVVGYAADGDMAEWQAGELTDLGPGSPDAINNRGEILGYRNGDVAVWQNGTVTDLGPDLVDEGEGINDRGDVIWTRSTDPDPSVYSTLLWQDGKTMDLGDSNDDQSFYAVAISNTDQVVGQFNDYDNGGSYSFVWQNGNMTRLPESPLSVVAMNDHNQIIGDDCGCYRRGVGRVYDSKLAVLWTLQDGKVTTTDFPGRIPRR